MKKMIILSSYILQRATELTLDQLISVLSSFAISVLPSFAP